MIEAWPDTGLYHRLRNALETLSRAKGTYGKRAYSAAQQIVHVSKSQFPAPLQVHYETVWDLTSKAAAQYENALYFSGLSNLTPKERDRFAAAVLALFEAAARARGHNENGGGAGVRLRK